MLERRSPTLFLIAGGVLVIYAALNGLWAFTNMVTEQNGLEIGYVLGFLGLLGLYPTLVGRGPWVTRAGAVAAVCGIVALSFISVNDPAQLAGITSGNLPGWSVFRFLPLVGSIVGDLSFGVASLRSDTYPLSVGLLMTPGLIVVVMLVHIVAGYASAFSAFVISAGEAMATRLLALPFRRHPRRSQTTHSPRLMPSPPVAVRSNRRMTDHRRLCSPFRDRGETCQNSLWNIIQITLMLVPSVRIPVSSCRGVPLDAGATRMHYGIRQSGFNQRTVT